VLCAPGLGSFEDGNEPDVESAISFSRDIRPILAANCFACHGPDEGARRASLRLDEQEAATAPRRRSDPAITPGDSGASELIRRVTAADIFDRMPPEESGKHLTPDQIDLLRRWIDEGATYEPHWSFTQPARPNLPQIENASWPRNEIDHFILARLEGEGLAPSAEADRATLIRRLSLDLIGLPPTLEEVAAFVNDASPDAYGKVVERLLASPHYGERWARVWLDLARYADTRGYEKDSGRTIWPWRDWVIDAFNDDMPFDQFTIEQIAGDLLPDSTPTQRLATAFHRNTMNNDEGGTQDEEFRVAAVIDRVNTTMQAWMGLTAGCAQCHSHKYDPISHREYFQLFAFFNQTEDADQTDERPVMAVRGAPINARLAELDAQLAELDQAIRAALDAAPEPQSEPSPPGGGQGEGSDAVDYLWLDDDLPAGVNATIDGASAWQWLATSNQLAPYAGTRAFGLHSDGLRQSFFTDALPTLQMHDGDQLFAHVFLDPANPPRQIMLQWHSLNHGWNHRAYWGENLIEWGQDGTTSRVRIGDLPKAGEWVRLEVDPAQVGLSPGSIVDGVAFTQFGGFVAWDAAGVRTASLPNERMLRDFDAWLAAMRQRLGAGLPETYVALLAADPATISDHDRESLRDYFVQNTSLDHRATFEPFNRARERLVAERQAIEAALPQVPIMRELAPEYQRPTHILIRGSHLNPGETVHPGVPEAFHDWSEAAPLNRLGLAQWLVSRENPLTARVAVNRHWEQFFGRGLVETSEDFGTQGMFPTHSELLDWLAIEFMERGWSMKELCRQIVMSATYRQSSHITRELLEIDPDNRLLARSPRYRLDAEVVRDQALAASGLINPALHGPPVFPPQPAGEWEIVYSNETWIESAGADRYRRAIYTYWRRTSPYPSMVTFDGVSREFCVPRRIRTNTPLQALVTLNDPVYVEAAQALARRIVNEGGASDASRANFGLRLCLAREGDPEEIAMIVNLVESECTRFASQITEARALAGIEDATELTDDAAAQLAAWTIAANVLLNLDEFLTRP
jgi:hypothetical protein